MARSITVRSGFKVQLPEPYGEQNGPVTLTITDAVYGDLDQDNFHASDASKPLIDNGPVAGSDDAVVAAAPFVANLAGGADLPTTVAKVNEILTALRTPGGPMATS